MTDAASTSLIHSGARNSGSYSFNSTSSPFTSGDPSLDFLLGVPGSYNQGSGAEIEADAFLNYVFAQDSWKLTPTLTMDYGVGYSVDTPLYNHQYSGEAVVCLIPGQTSASSQPLLWASITLATGCGNAGQATITKSEFGPGSASHGPPTSARSPVRPVSSPSTQASASIMTVPKKRALSRHCRSPPFGLTSGGAVDYGALAPAFANPWQDLDSGAVYHQQVPIHIPQKRAKHQLRTLRANRHQHVRSRVPLSLC